MDLYAGTSAARSREETEELAGCGRGWASSGESRGEPALDPELPGPRPGLPDSLQSSENTSLLFEPLSYGIPSQQPALRNTHANSFPATVKYAGEHGLAPERPGAAGADLRKKRSVAS